MEPLLGFWPAARVGRACLGVYDADCRFFRRNLIESECTFDNLSVSRLREVR